MILTEEQIKADNERWKGRDIKQELYYLSYAVPNRRSVTNDDLRFNAFVARKALGMIENIRPEQRWIPCSERLPEEDGTYIVSGIWGSGKEQVGECEYLVEDGYFQTAWNFDVKAWMPLPKPWEGERNEHKRRTVP